jgi:hypothetical protein
VHDDLDFTIFEEKRSVWSIVSIQEPKQNLGVGPLKWDELGGFI